MSIKINAYVTFLRYLLVSAYRLYESRCLDGGGLVLFLMPV